MVSRIVDEVFELVDGICDAFVTAGYKAIVNHGLTTGLFTIIFTLFVMLTLFKLKEGVLSGQDAIFTCLKGLIVFLLATDYHIFYTAIYNVATNGPLELSKILSNVMNDVTGKNYGTSSLSDVYQKGINNAGLALNHSSMGIKSFFILLFFSGLILTGTLCHVGLALCILCLAKFSLAYNLVVAPYFILMYLFNGTRNNTSSWVCSLLTSACIPVVVGVALFFTLTLADKFLIDGNATSQAPNLFDVVAYLLTSIISLSVIWRSTSIVSGWFGSQFAVEGRTVMNVMRIGQGKANSGVRGIKEAKSNFATRQARLMGEIAARNKG
jgi:type IV secretory pathway VirB6-like protein